jgi:ABC-2 type transport system permease protein
MNKTLLVMANEIGATLRRKMFTIFAFGIPLVLGIVALIVMAVNRNADPIAASSTETDPLSATERASEGYVDQGDLVKLLPADVPPGWLREYPTEAAAQAALQAEEISAYTIIPADYVETGEIIHVRPEYNPLSGDTHSEDIERVLLLNLLGGDSELAATVWAPLDVQVTHLSPAGSEEETESWITDLFPNLMTFTLYMVILMPAGGLVNAITDEKKNRVMEVLMSSVSPRQMIAGKILALGLLGLLQAAAWVAVMGMVVRFGGQSLNIPPDLKVETGLFVWLFVYFLLGYAMYGALLAGVGALAPDVKDTRGASFVMMSPLMAVYMFLIVIFESPNGILSLVMSLFPLTSPVGIIARMTVVEVPLWQSALAAALQLLTAVVIVRVVARLFRAQHLLSGQPLSTGRFFAAFLERA